jgi:pimeloyl-ACP methyl ester carboxylesterase
MAFYTNSQGLDISYAEAGDTNAQAILFFDGFGSPYEIMPNMLFDVLAKAGYHCIAFDYRGYGKSSPSKYNSMAWCALDAKELLEHLNIDKAVFCGVSMGVSVILGYFKAYGDLHVDRIILFDQPPSVTTREDWPYGRLRGKQDMAKLADSLSKMFHDPDAFFVQDTVESSPAAFPELDLPAEMRLDMRALPAELQAVFEKVQEEVTKNLDPLARIATWYDSGFQDYRSIVPAIKVPALVFAPDPGSLYEYEATEYYRDHLGGPAEFVVLKPATHFAMMEHPETITKHVLAYLAKEDVR